MKVLTAALMLLCSSVMALTPEPEGRDSVSVRHAQMVYPVVLVAAESGTGSGTVIYSAQIDDEWHNYVLTNHHVVAGNIRIQEVWDSGAAKKVPKETRKPLEVKWFIYNDFSKPTGNSAKRARIVAWDKQNDLALLRIDDTEREVSQVAHLIDRGDPLYLTERVWAVGAGLGRPPFATSGHVSLVDHVEGGLSWTLMSAPIIFGNSGGALYRWSPERARYELVGVPSAVATAGWATIVQSMGIAIPMERVYEFLDRNCYGPIVSGELGEDCEALGKAGKKDKDE